MTKSLTVRSTALLLAMLLCVGGCTQDVNTDPPDQDNTQPHETEQDQPGYESEQPEPELVNPQGALYYRHIAEVMAGTTTGITLVRLWHNGSPSTDVYTFDPADGSSKLVIAPAADKVVKGAAISDFWLAWVESSDDGWRMYVCPADNRASAIPIASGKYTDKTGSDFPTPALYGHYLAYNTSHDTEDSMISDIVLVNLSSGQSQIVCSVQGSDQYSGAPSLWGNWLTWHLGEWTRDMQASIYLYNIVTDQVVELPGTEGTSRITPVVSGSWLAWIEYEQSRPEIKNVMISPVAKLFPLQVTDATIDNRKEFHAPSLAFGHLTWQSNFTVDTIPYLHAGRMQSGGLHHPGFHSNALFGSWQTWRQSGVEGIFFFALTRIGPFLDLTPPDGQGITIPTELPEVTPDHIQKLSPADILLLYQTAIVYEDHEILRLICAPELLEAVTKGDVSPASAVSPLYLICGEMAYGAIQRPGHDFWLPIRLFWEEGVWKIPIKAAQ